MKHQAILALSAAFIFSSVEAFAGEKNYKQSGETDKWELRLSLPAWIAGVDGDTGVGAVSAGTSLTFGDIVPHVDMTASFRAELRKGNFGLYTDFLYMSLSDGIAGNGVIKKISGRQDEILADLGTSWRLIDTEKCWLEVIVGVRYVNLYEEIELYGSDTRIEEVSTRLARAGTIARGVVARELAELSEPPPNLPNAALGRGEPGRAAAAVQRVHQNTQNRQERIARTLRNASNQRISRTDDWFDPYIGLRGRYNLNEKYYFLGRADIGGFGVGSDLSWQASAGIGCQLSTSIFFELTYRALGMDYDHDGFIYDMVTHGPELSLGIIF